MENLSNNAQTTLSAGIDAAVTTIPVVATSEFPAAAFRIKIDNELMRVTATPSTSSWTVERGIEGSTAASHLSGAVVSHVLTAEGLRQFVIDLANIYGSSTSSGGLALPATLLGPHGAIPTEFSPAFGDAATGTKTSEGLTVIAQANGVYDPVKTGHYVVAMMKPVPTKVQGVYGRIHKPYRATMLLKPNLTVSPFSPGAPLVGVVFASSLTANGALRSYAFNLTTQADPLITDPALTRYEWSNRTTISGTFSLRKIYNPNDLWWIRITNDMDTMVVSYSVDGLHFIDVLNDAHETPFVPKYLGVFASSNASSATSSITLLSYVEEDIDAPTYTAPYIAY